MFQKGHQKIGGRQPGSQNKTTSTVKEVVLAVFQELQGDAKNNLKTWAKKEPTEFYKLAAKLIPTEVTGSVKRVIVVTDTDE